MYKNEWQTANEYNIWKSNVIKNETTEMARILCSIGNMRV